MAKIGRPKKYERTVKIQLTAEQWERVDQMAVVMGVSFAECVRMNIEAQLAPIYDNYRREDTNA